MSGVEGQWDSSSGLNVLSVDSFFMFYDMEFYRCDKVMFFFFNNIDMKSHTYHSFISVGGGF